jgi:predicted secreted hydrolase
MAVLMLFATCRSARAQERVVHAPQHDVDGFVRAGPGRAIVLPADHGSHPETRTEWWYVTGPLRGPDGELFGFQATWFRRALVAQIDPDRSPLAVRDVMLFHGALTDVAAGTLRFGESTSRAYPPWAGASTDGLAVHLFEQRLIDATGEGHQAELAMDLDGVRLQLSLDLDSSSVLLHGREPGLSIKGDAPGQASWYYTLPAIAVSGHLTRPGREPLPVSGRAWLDHEFGSSSLAEDQVGWDWFATVLDDGTELMAYQLRLEDGSPAATSSLSLRRPGEQPTHIDHEGFEIVPTGSWTSPRSGAEYPAGWKLRIPDHQLNLRVTPHVPDQELVTDSTGVTYWEGLCRFEGDLAGLPVLGDGYVELVGYAGSIADRFGTQAPGEAHPTKR